MSDDSSVEQKAPNIAVWQLVGVLSLVVSGVLVAVAAFMRPTVSAGSAYSSVYGTAPAEVFNAGLLQQQMMLFVGGLAGMIFAICALATASILGLLWRTRQR